MGRDSRDRRRSTSSSSSSDSRHSRSPKKSRRRDKSPSGRRSKRDRSPKRRHRDRSGSTERRDRRRRDGRDDREIKRQRYRTPPPVDDTESKVERAIKAAEAAGLTMCKPPTYERREVTVKEDMPTIQDRNALDEIEADSFAPKKFVSSRSKKISDSIVIDLDAGTVKIPDVELPPVDAPFHPDMFPDDKLRAEKWVKEMFRFRRRALRGKI